MKFSPTVLSLIITTSKINAIAGQALPSGWTDLGSGICVDESDKEFDFVQATAAGNICTTPQTKEDCAELCQCYMTLYNGINAMKGAFWGILVGAFDCSCYHDSSWVCANEIPASDVSVLCFTGSGATGSINGTAPTDPVYSSQDCLKFTSSQTGAPVTTSPTGEPIASVNPTTKAPTTTSSPTSLAPTTAVNPTNAPTTTSPTTTSSPTKALTYTPLNGTDGGFCADSFGRSYSNIFSYEIGRDILGGNCTQFPGNSQAFDYCSKWCTAYLPLTYLGLEVSLFIADGCWDCSCLFDDLTLANVTDETLELYNPDADNFRVSTGTGPINKTEVNSEYKATCYKLIDPTSAPTSAPTGKPIAITSAPTGKPIAITSAPTGKPIAATSAPTGKPIAITSAPTGKPTAASKSSKSVKATKVPSAKSSKSAKRV